MNLADLRGTPTVLNVWAAWCARSATEEMPVLAVPGCAGPVTGCGSSASTTTRPRSTASSSAADFGVPFPSVHDEDGDRVARGLRARRRRRPCSSPPTAGSPAGKIGAIRSQAQLDRLVQRYLGVRL